VEEPEAKDLRFIERHNQLILVSGKQVPAVVYVF
jgi:hypothetical protein